MERLRTLCLVLGIRAPSPDSGAYCRARAKLSELELRSLKVTLNLEDLRGKFPHMIRNEIWTHCLAYNLIRQTMASAAVTHERTPRTLSFAGATQVVAGAMTQASVVDGSTQRGLASLGCNQTLAGELPHLPPLT